MQDAPPPSPPPPPPAEGPARRVSVVLVTAPAGDAAVALARSIVEERLAACVNLVPSIRSIYRWQGAVEDDEEALLVLKAPTDRVEALRARVVELHPYDVPEVIALPVDAGHAPYLAWVLEQTGPAPLPDAT